MTPLHRINQPHSFSAIRVIFRHRLLFFYHCQIICLCQARLLFSAGRRFFLAWAYREEVSINDASSSIFRCCLSCVASSSSARLHPDAGAREPSRHIVLFLTILFIMTMNANRYCEGEERATSVFCTTALGNASALTRTISH